MSELTDIKKRLLDEDKIEELLEKAECENIKFRHNRYEAMLPSKFNSDNNRGLQVYLNESLTCKIRSRTFLGTDIFDLISYIVFDCVEHDEIKKCLPRSKKWICEKLGYTEYLNDFQWDFDKPKDDPLKWLKDLKKKRNKKKYEIHENQVYDDSILNQYTMHPYEGYINEGVDYDTQKLFEIGIDVQSERIVFPIRNAFGEIISVKGRSLSDKDNIPKYLYMYNFNKSLELYNWSYAVFHILEKKEIIIFEGEKSCWKAYQWGYKNCVALGGGDITDCQIQMIKGLGLDISICLSFDRDKTPDNIKQQAKKFGFTHSIYVLWDGRKQFSAELKHSPTDLGEDAFRLLYEDRHKYKIS